ncbi:MAG: TIGR00366 family protein [Candidatus Bathyarchaeota archaeon]
MGEKKVKVSFVEKFAEVLSRIIPDALTAALLMAIALLIWCLLIGTPVIGSTEFAGMKFKGFIDSFYTGLWTTSFMVFTLQMALIATLGSVIARAPLVSKAILRAFGACRTKTQFFIMVGIITAILGYVHWGLAIMLGPMVALYACTEAEKKNINLDVTLMVAFAYTMHGIWQYGLSSSEGLLMATPGHFLEKITGIWPISTTLYAPASIIMEILWIILCVGVFIFFHSRLKEVKPISSYPEALSKVKLIETATDGGEKTSFSLSERLERSRTVAYLLAILLLCWVLYDQFIIRTPFGLNTINTIFFLLGLILHGSILNFSRAIMESVRAAWAVIICYPIYAGIASIISSTPIGYQITQFLGGVTTPLTYPLAAALAGAIVAIFVPSSGGQWMIQGETIVKSAALAGVDPRRGMLSLMVGDQIGNYIAPFWYVVCAGVAGLDFRRFYGYGLLGGIAWFILGVVVFTFAPL